MKEIATEWFYSFAILVSFVVFQIAFEAMRLFSVWANWKRAVFNFKRTEYQLQEICKRGRAALAKARGEQPDAPR